MTRAPHLRLATGQRARSPGADMAARRRRFEALDLLNRPVWIFDVDQRRIHWANRKGLTLWRAATVDELAERDLGADMSEAVAHRLQQYQQDFERGDRRFNEQWTLYPLGIPRTIQVEFSGVRLDDGRMAMFCEGHADTISDTDSLRSVEALMHTTVMISLYDIQGRALYQNPAAREAMPDAAFDGRARFVHASDLEAVLADLRRDGRARRVARVHTARGERWHEMSARRCRDAASGRNAWLVSEVDVTDLKRAEARANYLAHHDTLTGLPNRNYVLHAFQDKLAELRHAGREAALVFIDLDHFKTINDSLGHAAGDELLVRMAARLRSVIREQDMVARLGGDEFLVLAQSRHAEAEAQALSVRIRDAVSQGITLGNTEVHVTPSVGVCLFPRDGDNIDALMRHADLAMYRVKENGRNGVAVYTPDLTATAHTRLTLESELRRALDRHEFEVFYQPRLDMTTQTVVGAEALVRWRHPERGLVPPGAFIPMCEESGLIHPLGTFVLTTAMQQQAAWAERGIDLSVSVNLSPRQLADPSLCDRIGALLAQTACDPARIELEITESMLVGEDEATLAVLTQLSALGLRIAIDDFGTGYSNLAYLQRYPIHSLKIDRTFVQGIGTSEPLAEMIVALCRTLRLRAVAEGVETAEQFEWLAARQVHEFQGFLYSPPLPVDQFEALVPAFRRGHAAG